MRKFLAMMAASALAMSLFAGCDRSSDVTVSVQSVGMLTGLGNVGVNDSFAGVVEAGETVNVDRNEQMELAETLVKAGDVVKQGDVLFTYNTESLSLDLEKLQLELEQLKNSITTKNAQIKELEKEKASASKDDQLDYTLQIQTLQVDVKETEYSVTAKQKEIDRAKATLADSSVVAPVDGTIKEINSSADSYDDRGNRKSFIVITQSGEFRVKGTLNELSSLSEGIPVIVRSRVDDSSWRGTVSKIDTDNPSNNNNNNGMYYGYDAGNEMTSSSNYPFYVELESTENLMLGQHVYIEPDLGQDEERTFSLSSYYIVSPDSDPYVWAAGKDDKLEKRSITLGDYNEQLDEYEIVDGLELSDYIADPNEPCEEGASVSYYDESSFGGDVNMPGNDIVDDGMIDDGIIDDGMIDDGMIDDGITDGAITDGVIENETNGGADGVIEALPAR